MARPKGLPKTGGRKPGSKNKIQLRSVRQMLADADFDVAAELKRLLDDPATPHQLRFDAIKWAAELHPKNDSEDPEDEAQLLELAK